MYSSGLLWMGAIESKRVSVARGQGPLHGERGLAEAEATSDSDPF